MASLSEAMPAPRPRGAGAWKHFLAHVALWRRRNRERRELLAMNSLQRHDIGITHLDVWREVNKPFWRM